jgi:glycosyltransferase involved in cell wall biosynthesis
MYNSKFHKDSFIDALRTFLKQFPDHNEFSNIDAIQEKSEVSHLGLSLQKFDDYKTKSKNEVPIILWNHRWEYDKNPASFFQTLWQLKDNGIQFKLVVLGEEFETEMDVFTQARNHFSNEILHMGYCDSFQDYAKWLWKSNYLPVTSNQEFFGASVMEAVYCNTIPILPNRLAYPELFHIQSNPNSFYKTDEDLTSRLMELIRSNKSINTNKLSGLASQFDWEIIASRYDSLLLRAYENKKSL